MITGNSWLNPKLKVKESKSHGKGIFAIHDVKKGERVCIFGGSIIDVNDIESLPEEKQYHVMQIEERFVIGNIGKEDDTDYFNHSCDPNSGFQGQIFLVAMRNIKKGEEVTFDYAMVVSESPNSDLIFEMDCECGAKNCRKIITEDDWKQPELRKRYKDYFSEYIKQKIISENYR